MKPLLLRLCALGVIAAGAGFAVSNRQSARLNLDVFALRELSGQMTAIDAPLYLLLLAALFVGVFLGAMGLALSRRRK